MKVFILTVFGWAILLEHHNDGIYQFKCKSLEDNIDLRISKGDEGYVTDSEVICILKTKGL